MHPFMNEQYMHADTEVSKSVIREQTQSFISEITIMSLTFTFICIAAWIVFSNTVRGQNMGLTFDPGRLCVAATARYVRL